MDNTYNAETQFNMFLEKMNLLDKEIDDSDRAELIELYDSLYGAVKTKCQNLFPSLSEIEIDKMARGLLVTSTKYSLIKEQEPEPEIKFNPN